MKLGQPQQDATFHSTAAFSYQGVGVGFMNADDGPLPAVPGGDATFRVDHAGPGVHRMMVVAADPSKSAALIDTALETPAPVLEPISMLSISRWGPDGNAVSAAPVTFEFTVSGNASLTEAEVYHYAAGSASGTRLVDAGGTIGPCRVPSDTCLRVTSFSTSAFAAWKMGRAPKGYCAAVPNRCAWPGEVGVSDAEGQTLNGGRAVRGGGFEIQGFVCQKWPKNGKMTKIYVFGEGFFVGPVLGGGGG